MRRPTGSRLGDPPLLGAVPRRAWGAPWAQGLEEEEEEEWGGEEKPVWVRAWVWVWAFWGERGEMCLRGGPCQDLTCLHPARCRHRLLPPPLHAWRDAGTRDGGAGGTAAAAAAAAWLLGPGSEQRPVGVVKWRWCMRLVRKKRGLGMHRLSGRAVDRFDTAGMAAAVNRSSPSIPWAVIESMQRRIKTRKNAL